MSLRTVNGGANSNSGINGFFHTDMQGNDENNGYKRIAPRQWVVKHMNWSWFTCTQSTGGVAIVLSESPKQFQGLQTIGKVIFIFNIVLYLSFILLIALRWITNPRTFKLCFTEGPECAFYGSFWLSFATMIICMERFGKPNVGEWLVVAIRVLFWMYAAMTLLNSTLHLSLAFKYTPVVAMEMSPVWFLSIFNAMLTGTIAGSIAPSQPPPQRMPIIVAGIGYHLGLDCFSPPSGLVHRSTSREGLARTFPESGLVHEYRICRVHYCCAYRHSPCGA